MASAKRSTAHQIQQQQQQQQILKCPRCNSSNTKFCYYNNYSLSQPRHFCKACKRHWTRGGTLRNVPVGGGCRKNKRIKTTLTTLDNKPNPNFNPNPNLDHPTSSNNILNPLYGLLQRNSKQPRFNTRYDLIQPQTSSFRLGFSSLDRGDPSVARAHNSLSLVTSSKVSGGFTSSYSDNMISSLLASSLQQQPIYVGFPPYGSVVNEVQIEGSPKISTNWNTSLDGENDDDDQIKALESSDPTSFLWTITGGDGGSEWHDPTSYISVHSLI